MVAALRRSYNDIGEYLRSESTVFCEDMRDYNLKEVMYSYQNFKARTHKGFSIQNAIRAVERIEEAYDVVITPDKVTSQFYILLEEQLLERGLKPSTINKYFQNIVTALKYGRDYGCRLHPTFADYEKRKYEVQKIALTPDNVSQIYHYDFSRLNCRPDHIRNLERVRDMFCLACCLGQRYSDMKRLQPDWYDSLTNVIRLVQQKTGNTARIDISRYAIDRDMALSILRKYNFEAPYKADIGNFDDYLKEVLQIIGGVFNKEITCYYKVGGEMHSDTKCLWQMIASHTARRTFASVNIKRGYTEAEVRRCTGHTSSECFSRYVIYDD